MVELTPASKSGERKIRKGVERYRKASRKQKKKVAVKARVRIEATDQAGNLLVVKRVITLK